MKVRLLQTVALAALCGCVSAKPGAEVVILKPEALKHVHATEIGGVYGESFLCMSERQAIKAALDNLKRKAQSKGANALTVDSWDVLHDNPAHSDPGYIRNPANISRFNDWVTTTLVAHGTAYRLEK